jgi:hypothetical protein
MLNTVSDFIFDVRFETVIIELSAISKTMEDFVFLTIVTTHNNFSQFILAADLP